MRGPHVTNDIRWCDTERLFQDYFEYRYSFVGVNKDVRLVVSVIADKTLQVLTYIDMVGRDNAFTTWINRQITLELSEIENTDECDMSRELDKVVFAAILWLKNHELQETFYIEGALGYDPHITKLY